MKKTTFSDLYTPRIEARFRYASDHQPVPGPDIHPETLIRPNITISREFGCDGYPLAEALVEAFGTDTDWRIFSKELNRVVETDSTPLDTLESRLDDQARTTFEEYLDALLAHKPTDYMKFKRLAKAVKLMVRNGHTIIVGSGGAHLTRTDRHVLHLRLVAPVEFRIRNVAVRLGIPTDEAERMVVEHSNQREEYIQKYTRADVRDPYLYDLVINNERVDVPTMVRLVTDTLRARGWTA